MAVWRTRAVQRLSGASAGAESPTGTIGPINLGRKQAGKPSAGKPHAACDVAGAGNGATAIPNRARRGKPRIQAKEEPTATAPVLDPTDVAGAGNGATAIPKRARRGKPRIQAKEEPTGCRASARPYRVSTGRLRFRRKAASCSRSAAFSMATAWWPLSRRRTNRITDKRRAGMCPDCSPSSALKSTCTGGWSNGEGQAPM